MKFRILISVFTIIMVVSVVSAATYAYFSDGEVLGNNTFSTGNVYLGNFNKNIVVTGLTPGVPVMFSDIAIEYTGNLNADLYVGARGNTNTPADYLADKLYLRIYPDGSGTAVWEGWVQDLSTGWRIIGTNVTAGWQTYDLEFTLDPNAGNDYQGKTNTNTEILIYSVQTGGSVPTTQPSSTTGTTGWFNL